MPDGSRTLDSVLAQDLYAELTRLGYRAFYAPESLTGLLGANYEAAIYHAISTAQVMLVVGACPEHFESTWVRSEWRRFLAQIDSGARKRLVALYRGMPAEKLPREFLNRRLQSVDMDRLGALLDVDSFLQRYIRREPPHAAETAPREAPADAAKEPAETTEPESPMDALKRRAESGDGDAAMELGRRHETVDGVERSIALAGYWYAQAMVRGRTEAMAAIARLSVGQPAEPEKHEPPEPARAPEAVESPEPSAQRGAEPGELFHQAQVLWNTGTDEQVRAVVGGIEALARQGDREGQYWLARCCAYGMGVEADKARAAALYRQSAEQGFADAQYALGDCYRTGSGVEKNGSTADAWYRRAVAQYIAAAEAGDMEAKVSLGRCYERGLGVEKDRDRAVALFREAAEHGNAKAQYLWGIYLHFDKNDPEAAKVWMRRSADQNDPEAEAGMGAFFSSGEEGFRWVQRAFEHGGYGAAGSLASYYRYGNGVEKNPAEAFRLYMLDAKHGHSYACYQVGDCCMRGFGAEKNPAEAAKWYRRAVEGDVRDAMVQLGRMYEQGIGVEKDPAGAFRLYTQAAEKDDKQGAAEAGRCCENGIGTAKDEDAALRWYEKAGTAGEPWKRTLENRIAQRAQAPDEAVKPILDKLFEEVDRATAEPQKDLRARSVSSQIREHLMEESMQRARSVPPRPKIAPQEYSEAERVRMARKCYEGKEAERDPDRALRLLKPLENSENAQARYLLGMLYLEGTPSQERDLTRAADHIIASAQKDHPEASYEMSRIFRAMKGENQPDAEKKAEEWLERAANLGSANAQCELGDRYFYHSDRKDLAREWYEKAADQQHPRAEYMTGYIWENGLGVLNDYDEAEFRYKSAAKHGYADAQYKMGEWCERNMFKEPDHEEKAEEWYRKAAAQDHAGAMYRLAMMKYEKKDRSGALELLQKAKAKGHRESIEFLRKHLKFGRLW